MSSPYKIDWSADLGPGLEMLGAAFQKRHENDRAEENTAIQRMYADAQLRRMSNQEVRDRADQMRKDREEQSAALEKVADYLLSNPGVAQGIGKIHGIPITKQGGAQPTNPLFNAVAPPRIETQNPSDALPGSIDGAEFDPAFAASPEVADVNAQVQRDLDKQNRLSGADQRDIALIGPQYHPNAEDATPPPPKGPGDLSTDELMVLALPDKTAEQELAGQPQGQTFTPAQAQGSSPSPPAALPLLYQAVLGGQTYDLSAEAPTTGLGPKYDDYLKHLMTMPGKKSREQAMAKVYELYQKDQHEGAVNARASAATDSRENLYQTHHLDVDQLIQQRDLDRENRLKIARILAAAKRDASGNVTDPRALAEIAKIAEQFSQTGSVPEAIGAAAESKVKIPLKAVESVTKQQTTQAASGERSGQKREALAVNDIAGNYIGDAHNPTQANQIKKQTDQFAQAKVRLEELIKDIERTGSRVLEPNEIQQRLSKAESVNAAMRVYNGLGATDASQRLESRITGAIGTPGHGFIMGANVDVIRRILHEAELQHDTRVRTALKSGGSQLSPVLGGPKKTNAPQTEDEKDAAFLRSLLGK